MNRFSKIDKWLKSQGYLSEFVRYDTYRYYDSFHKGDFYHLDVYRISNGLYILVKAEGKPRYILSRTDEMTGHILLDFSQQHFVKRLESSKYFPEDSQEPTETPASL